MQKYFFFLLIVCVLIVGCSPPAQIQPTPTPTTGKWISKTSIDEFDDSKKVFIFLQANEPIQGWLDIAIPILVIRCTENSQSFEVFISVDVGFEFAEIKVRYDGGEATQYGGGTSNDKDAIFFYEPEKKLKTLLAHKEMLVGFTPFNASPVTTTFDLRGLSEAVKPVKTVCNIP